ncbi:MAG: hypothetical protein WBA93_03520 [Microcoleaceae cyanobacterium]
MIHPNNYNRTVFTQEHKSMTANITTLLSTPKYQETENKTKPQLVEPSIEWVLEFGYRIGIAQKYLDYISNQLTVKKAFWFEYLHKIAHYAVKDNSYLDYWWEHQQAGGIPNMNWSCINSTIVYHQYHYYNSLDFTPDEHGVRAWSLSALWFNNWRNPINSLDWQKYQTKYQKNPTYLWTKSYIYSKHHPVHSNGFEQLKAVGIDFTRDNFRYFRPQKKFTVGWQPIFTNSFNCSS